VAFFCLLKEIRCFGNWKSALNEAQRTSNKIMLLMPQSGYLSVAKIKIRFFAPSGATSFWQAIRSIIQ